MTKNAASVCPECGAQGSAEVDAHEMSIVVGDKTVKAHWQRFPKCRECGFYELSAEQLRLIELRTAITVLRDCGAPSGAALKYARKALGMRQVDLQLKLNYTAETISRVETEAMKAPLPYALALGGLLDCAIIEAMGGDPEAVVVRASQAPETEVEIPISKTG